MEDNKKITPIEAIKMLIKPLITLKALGFALFFSVFGVTIFLGIFFYTGMQRLSVNEQKISAIVEFINTNLIPKK